MARARNIKPGFFTNDELGELDPLARLAFIGMWTVADYKGCFEYRPKRLKAEILPYDDCDIDQLAKDLDKSGFITIYTDGESNYIQINNFEKHQNPHKNERAKGSDIPAFGDPVTYPIDNKGLAINRDKNGTAPEKNETDPADSLFLIPDSGFLNPVTCAEQSSPPPVVADEPEEAVITLPLNTGKEHPVTQTIVDEFKSLYPAVDVVAELRSMRGWLLTNPKRRKTKSGINAFMNNWLSKTQNRGGSTHENNQQRTRHLSAIPGGKAASPIERRLAARAAAESYDQNYRNAVGQDVRDVRPPVDVQFWRED